LNKNLYKDLHDAASSIGRGDDYEQAMNEYRRASQLNHALKTVGKAAGVGAAGAAGAGSVYKLAKELKQ
jgi:hypothetical protein